MGVGSEGEGRTSSGAAGGASTATADARRASSLSKGERWAGCSAMVTNLDRTSREAFSDAAAVCARRSGGSALVGRLLAQAETTSLTAWCISSADRCKRSRLSRSARAMACSTGVGCSCAMAKTGRTDERLPFDHCVRGDGWRQPYRRVVCRVSYRK